MPGAAAKAATVYRISPLRFWLPIGFFILLAILLFVSAAFSSADADAQRAFLLTGFFILGCACVLYVLLRYARLELSPTGVKLYQIGYTLETAWDNVAALYDVAGAEGLLLRRPMQCAGAAVLRRFRNGGVRGGLRLYNEEQARLLEERRFIPIEAFAHWLTHGQLRADILRHARVEADYAKFMRS